MAVKLLCLCLLLALLCSSWAGKQTCLRSASSCEECIQSGPECAWCTAPNSDVRCHNLRGLRRAGCHKSHIYNPQGLVQVVKNESSTEPGDAKTLFLQPQEFSVRLRPGVSQTFPLTITMPTDQPVPELMTDTTNVPAGVNITLSRLTVEAAQCPSKSDDDSNQNRTGPWFVHITPRGFSLGVRLEISLDCQCDCSRSREESSVACSGHGALTCGQCECYDSYTGPNCQRDKESSFSRNDDFCRSGRKDPVCSGRGSAWTASVSAWSELTPNKDTADDTASAPTLTVLTPTPKYAEAMGRANVDTACVTTTGQVKTAAAPWKLPPVWQQTSSCATVEGCVSAASVNVSHRTLARPVRAALTVRTHVSSTWSVWSVGRLGRERRRTGVSNNVAPSA